MTGPVRSSQVLAGPRPSTRAKTRPSGRIHVGRLTRRSARDRPATGSTTGSPTGSSDWRRRRRRRRAERSREALEVGDVAACGERALRRCVSWNASSSATISSTRSSELRPSSSSVVSRADRRGPARSAATQRTSTESAGAGACAGARACRRTQSRSARALQLARALGARQLAAGPDRARGGSSGDPASAALAPPHDRVEIGAGLRARARRARAPRPPPSVAPTTADSRTPG